MTSEVDNSSNSPGGVDGGRRHFLLVATTVTGIAGAAMTAVPFLASWKPSARAQALGAPVEQDISKLEPGAMVKVNWRGQAIFIVRRSPEMMKQIEDPALADRLRDPKSEQSEQPKYAQNDTRSLKPDVLVLVGEVDGAVAGYLYWLYIGCMTGSCAITSDPTRSTLYFSVMGALFMGMFKKAANKEATTSGGEHTDEN